VQRSAGISTSRGKNWEWRHSLWLLWTFTLGLFSWLAFAYIGIRGRHPRWLLWAVFYATPVIFFAVIASVVSQSWANATLTFNALFSVVPIIHAFLLRKEYLLRLDLIKRETGNVSVTSQGRRWEWLHSLWMLWTLTLGLFSWIAFFYIALRARRPRWLVWGTLYFAAFLAFTVLTSYENRGGEIATGLMIVVGIVSVVHAFAIRDDYLVRLERRIHETAETASQKPLTTREDTETTFEAPTEPPPEAPPAAPSEELAQPTSTSAPEPSWKAPDMVPSESSEQTPVREPDRLIDYGATVGGSPMPVRIADTYPLPIAYSWSMLQGIWDPRERYIEQLRHAENMLAFLGSISLAVLDEGDYERAQLDLKLPWQGGISFGAWRLIVQRSAKVFGTYQDHQLATDICKLNIGSETRGFGADIAALIRARNEFHHGRGPVMAEDVVEASNEAQERMERCMDTLAFFTQYPIRLVQDFDVDRRNGDFTLKCLRLTGDGPGFSQERMSFPKALPRGDMVLDLGHKNWVQLYPFIVASNCPSCRYRETYFIDRWNDRKSTAVLKSFERGHMEEQKEIAGALAALAQEPQRQPEA
jgi:hypothetical protein